MASTELLSARDSTGHGSHAASTAAGEEDVTAVIDGRGFGSGSGVAPAAHLAVYKACWTAPDPVDDGCSTADLVAAVDAAVADGVDVLSYSVEGSADPVDSVGLAFLGAASANVFVAASAGNDGPAAGTVGNTSPWVTTVGASTHRLRQGGVVLGDGTVLVGAMVGDRSVPSSRVVRGADVPAPAATGAQARVCALGSLDAALVQDRVVVCERGRTPRVEKSAAVSRAGGAAMVLVNSAAGPGDVEADVHAVPTVHLAVADAVRLAAYLDRAGERARVALDPDAAEDEPVPTVAPFSGRGPVAGGDVLKPDLTAPGVGVVGAVAPPSDDGRLWDLRSGTSVSAPHVAGLAALLHGLHPTWSPSRLHSAMSTTAQQLAGDAGPFAVGSGQVLPRDSLDPGLVLDVPAAAWRRYAAGELAGQDLNLPSVSVPRLVGSTTLVRRLTHVGARPETYTASVAGLGGLDVRVAPATLTLQPGQSRRVRITLTATSAAPATGFATGSLRWTGARHEARLPVVVRTASVAAPQQVVAERDSGSVAVRARSGAGRAVQVRSGGLVPARPVGLTLRPGSFDERDPQVDQDTFATSVHVPAGTEAVRIELDGDSAQDDGDLYLFRGRQLVASSATPAADAEVTLASPPPGDYTLYVHAAASGDRSTTTGRLLTWVVPETGGTPLELQQPGDPTGPGGRIDYAASWRDLDPTQDWLAVVGYSGSDEQTLLRVE
ncbi:S8 family serine peptidase [Nocardioides mesophilus]|uniref:S8 family serine peptidase n=1 Tax=Nocardioides mesophilus TaxID=433659 RepID=A0A7G9RDV7_9ACTN|nr:S8 family serine peptidase [Nocardioides mesophilus]